MVWMAFLNLMKKDGSQSSQQDVPDELPSLAKTAKQDAKKEEIAPDELPPLKSAPKPEVRESPMVVEASPRINKDSELRIEDAQQLSTEQKLYFSSLVSKLQKREYQEQAEQEILSAASSEVMAHLKTQWQDEKNDNMLQSVEQKIIEKMQPLQLLEQEWRALRTEVDLKSHELRKREDAIRKYTDEIKELILEKGKLVKQINKKKESKIKAARENSTKSQNKK